MLVIRVTPSPNYTKTKLIKAQNNNLFLVPHLVHQGKWCIAMPHVP